MGDAKVGHILLDEVKGSFLDDNVNGMSIDRRWAHWMMEHMPWYDPNNRSNEKPPKTSGSVSDDELTENCGQHDKKAPSLWAAWHYYEHNTLPRYYHTKVKNRMNRNSVSLAPRGEEVSGSGQKTRLYPVWGTPLKQLGDFGIGIGLYFTSVICFAVITFLAGILNIYSMWHFWKDDSGFGDSWVNTRESLPLLLRGSAICTKTEWVDILNCDSIPPKFPPGRVYYNKGDDNCQMLRNVCGDMTEAGIMSWITLLFIAGAMYYIFFVVQRKQESFLDEEILTVSDYALEVTNPPKDARDPNEWKEFFMQFCDKGVRSCTIALDNEEMIRALIQRRILVRELKSLLPSEININDKDELLAQIQYLKDESYNNTSIWDRYIVPSNNVKAVAKYEKLYVGNNCIEEKIKDWAKQPKTSHVTNVFIVFETETDKRNALQRILNEKTTFKKCVLKVREPCESTAVRWKNLDENFLVRMKQQIVAFLAVFLFVGFGADIIYLFKYEFEGWASGLAFSVMFFNALVPQFCYFISQIEAHPSEGSYQASLYTKLTMAYWVNSALVYLVITDFTSFVAAPFVPVNPNCNNGGEEEFAATDSLLEQIYALFLWDMFFTPLLSVVDPAGLIARHFTAPRAQSQEDMNSNFNGTEYTLAERNTNMTRIFFLCFLYAPIYPACYFFCALSLFITYAVDKFMLLRRWAPCPRLGHQVSRFGREFFYTSAVVVLAIMTAYWWSDFPYDDICGNEDDGYYYCSQDFLGVKVFPPLPRKQETLNENLAGDYALRDIVDPGIWMSDGQAKLAGLCTWTSMVFLAIFVINLLWKFSKYVSSTVNGFEPGTEERHIDFGTLELLGQEISLYVPQIRMPGFNYPLLMCSIDNINDEHVGWRDLDRGFDEHNLIFDVDEINPLDRKRGGEIGSNKETKEGDILPKVKVTNPVFSIVKEWENLEVHDPREPVLAAVGCTDKDRLLGSAGKMGYDTMGDGV
eukprot:CAMPEP_0195512972 /NCGR_PEP_ID=MMETSP0794_2-20130614/4743_1 /TAXON_ID=515487 /ORGANISM="Stephanopyxis turris, Strain CCMP 815" /LENGTH=976 /DNA_ID=CAMNT_0040640871 /DNA_START=140 /DNA_END=3070 /DNA_ORIENTATION=+